MFLMPVFPNISPKPLSSEVIYFSTLYPQSLHSIQNIMVLRKYVLNQLINKSTKAHTIYF